MAIDKVKPEKINDKVVEEIKKRAIEGKLPCATARQIADELGVSYRDVGDAADLLRVKITSCQLGCF